MTHKFNEAMDALLKTITKAPEHIHKIFIEDISEISTKINQQFEKTNSIFRTFNLKNTGKYTFGRIICAPKNWNPMLELRLPIKIQPQFIGPQQFSEELVFKLNSSINHPIIRDGCVNIQLLNKLFELDMKKAIEGIGQISCTSGYKYSLSCGSTEINRICHFKIIAKHQAENRTCREILFQFTLAGVFPNDDSRYFFGLSTMAIRWPKWDAIDYKHKQIVHDWCHVLTLYFTRFNHSVPFPIVEPRVKINRESFISQPSGDQLLEFLKMYRHGYPFFEPTNSLLATLEAKLMEFKRSDQVELSELMGLFGMTEV